jgi:hypothetical protein
MSGDIAAAIHAEVEQEGSATTDSDFPKMKGEVIL